MILIDRCRVRPGVQAVRGRAAHRQPMLIQVLARKLFGVLAQKGDPTLDVIQCPYCRKIVEKKNAVESMLRLNRGGYIVTELRNYCSEQCAEYDQYAHES